MRKFFTLLTVALFSTTAWAQFFDYPELTPATKVVADGETEYIMTLVNDEGDDYFYSRGNDWNTRTSVVNYEEEALTVRFAPVTQTVNGEQVSCVRFQNYVDDHGGWAAAVDCDGGKSAWVDGQGRSGDGMWQITDLGNGQIELSNLMAPGGKFGLALGKLVWDIDEEDYIEADEEDTRLYFIGSEITATALAYDEDGEEIQVPAYIWGEGNLTTWQLWDAGMYNLKMQIIDFIDEEYEDYENIPAVVAAVNEMEELYNDEATTVAQLKAAFDKVKNAIALAAIEEIAKQLQNATEDDPEDATELVLKNNTFDEGTDGWDINMPVGNNHIYGGSHNYVHYDGFATFYESWGNGTALANGSHIKQTIAVPAGRWTVEADIIASKQGSSKEESKGTFLFATDSNRTTEVEVQTNNNSPEHITLMFETEGGMVDIGVHFVNPNVTWFAIDNFKVMFYGQPTRPWAQIELSKVCEQYEEKYIDYDEFIAQPEAIEAYEAALRAAQDAADRGGLTDDQYKELADSLRSKSAQLDASLNDYRLFADLIELAQETLAKMESSWPDCADVLADYIDQELQEAYKNGSWNREQIDEIPSNLSKIYGPYVSKYCKAGDDISFLLTNTTFDKNFAGWLTSKAEGYGSPWWGPGTGQPNLTGTMADYEGAVDGILSSGNAECFHRKFDMYQTIYDMPRGLYTITCQAFTRKDNTTMDAYIYALLEDGTEVKQAIMDLWDDASDEKIFENGGEWYGDAQQNGMYAPNGMGGANFYFEAGHYKNKFSLLVPEAGTVQIGIKTDSPDLWVLFDNFAITYEGTGASVWKTTIEEEAEKLKEKANDADMTDGEYFLVDAVAKNGLEFCENIDKATEEECAAMLRELKDQYARIAENIALQAQMETLAELLSNDYVSEKAEEADDELKARYDACCDAVINQGYMELTNAELKELIEEVYKVVALVKMPKGWENATDSNPADFTALIVNPQFNVDESYDPEGWDEPTPTGGYEFKAWQGRTFNTGGGAPANIGEVWNAGAFNAYQELTGLPAGIYELSCDGFIRNDGSIELSATYQAGLAYEPNPAFLYAITSEGKASTHLNYISEAQLTVEENEELEIVPSNTVTYNGYVYPNQLESADIFFKEGLYKKNSVICKVGEDGVLRLGIEKMNSQGADWVVVDNFELKYFGANSTQTPSEDANGIENVEVAAKKAIFTITGVRIQNALKPGLYIINGKKMLVK